MQAARLAHQDEEAKASNFFSFFLVKVNFLDHGALLGSLLLCIVGTLRIRAVFLVPMHTAAVATTAAVPRATTSTVIEREATFSSAS